MQDEPRTTTDAAGSVVAPSTLTARSLQELLAVLREFERADASPTQPEPHPLAEKTDTQS
jgi:hypothetical protein